VPLHGGELPDRLLRFRHVLPATRHDGDPSRSCDCDADGDHDATGDYDANRDDNGVAVAHADNAQDIRRQG
jgi:hypothetical protein